MGKIAPKQKRSDAITGSVEKRPARMPNEPVTRIADNKGRVGLGDRFANRSVIIQTLSETEVVIKLARVIPESESWLYENAEALAAVRMGLAQARDGKLTAGPDVAAADKIVAELED